MPFIGEQWVEASADSAWNEATREYRNKAPNAANLRATLCVFGSQSTNHRGQSCPEDKNHSGARRRIFVFDLATPRKCKVSRCDHGDSNAPKNWRFSKCNEGIRTMSINPTFEEQLVEQLRSIEINNDLEHDVYFYMDDIVRQRGKPEMMESLRLIVEDMIVDLRERQPTLCRDVTTTDVLLALANRGLVRFEGIAPIGSPDKYVWAATPELMKCLETGHYGIVKQSNRRRLNIRMDDLAAEEVNASLEYHKILGWWRRYTKMRKWHVRVTALLEGEKEVL
jgi:hypothetical protein